MSNGAMAEAALDSIFSRFFTKNSSLPFPGILDCWRIFLRPLDRSGTRIWTYQVTGLEKYFDLIKNFGLSGSKDNFKPFKRDHPWFLWFPSWSAILTINIDKHRCLIEKNVPISLILPSRWRDCAESLGMERTSYLLLNSSCSLKVIWSRNISYKPKDVFLNFLQMLLKNHQNRW